MAGSVGALLCGGEDCRERAGAWRKLREALGEAELVGCQKICAGPVCGLEIDGTVEWFSKVRGRELREAVVAAARGDAVEPALWGRRVKKRRGRIR
jgi:hypothetical protein